MWLLFRFLPFLIDQILEAKSDKVLKAFLLVVRLIFKERLVAAVHLHELIVILQCLCSVVTRGTQFLCDKKGK